MADIDLNKIANKLAKDKTFNWKIELEDGFLHGETHTCAKEYYDDDILVVIDIFNSRSLHMYFTFDSIIPSIRSYKLISSFNQESPWFKAYFSHTEKNCYLEVKFTSPSFVDEDDVINLIDLAFNKLIDDRHAALLKELTEITEG